MELFENTKIDDNHYLFVDPKSLTEVDANLTPDEPLYNSFKIKIISFQKMIEKSIVASQKYKSLDTNAFTVRLR